MKTKLLLAVVLCSLPATPGFSGTVLRTLVYHQVTQFTNTGVHGYYRSLALSADGTRIVCARPLYSSPRTNLIQVLNFDGSGLQLADRWPGSAYAAVDISADGSRILSWDGGIARLVNADGSNAHQVIQVNGGYPDCRLSPNGAQIYFSNDRPFIIPPEVSSREPGIYVVNADGTGLHEVAGVGTFAVFLGTTTAGLMPSGVLPDWSGTPFAISGDGSKLACFVWTPVPTNHYTLLGLNSDGTGLHELPLPPLPIYNFNKVAISGDGNKVCYDVDFAPPSNSGVELGVFNWDGSGRRIYYNTYSTNQTSPGLSVHDVSVNCDGSKLLFGETSWLFNTDGSGRLELGWSVAGAQNMILGNGGYDFYEHGVMDSNGTHIVFLTVGIGSLTQVATAELNPAGNGLAPAILGASVSPAYITTNGSSPLFAFSPMPTNGLVLNGGAQAGILLNGVADPSYWEGSILHDNGANGDAVKGDGLYSDNSGYFYYRPAIGPRTIRFRAERLGADGNYHATAIDVAPFFVVDKLPTNPPPTISSISPAAAGPGNLVTITGTGFDSVATNNVVLFGNAPAQVVSADPAGTQLLVLVPIGISPGAVTLSVSSQGQSSNPSPFAAAIPIVNLARAGTNFSFSFLTASNQSYTIQRCDWLNSTNWILHTNFIGNGSVMPVVVPITNAPQRFFRVRQP
jgi:hypothetical protein